LVQRNLISYSDRLTGLPGRFPRTAAIENSARGRKEAGTLVQRDGKENHSPSKRRSITESKSTSAEASAILQLVEFDWSS
jgi:hypothetical protein